MMTEPTTTAPTLTPDAPAPRLTAWHRAMIVGLIAYVVSRLCVLAGAGVRAAQMVVDSRQLARLAGVDPQEPSAAHTIAQVLTSWDGRWYLAIIRDGYPSSIPANITYSQNEARAAFFPVYPWLARAVDVVLPGGDTFAAIMLNLALGAVAVLLVGLLAKELYGVGVAARAMLLFAVFPGSFVLSFTYSEATLIVLAAACLLFLLREQWWLAGVAAMLGTGTRPNGLALVAACAVASFLAIRRTRAWGSLVAVVLSPLGFIFFQLYVDHTAGERGAWFRVQREAWSEGTSYGATAVSNTADFFLHPLSSPTDALTALSMIALVAMVWCAWKVRLHPVLASYCAVVVGLMLVTQTVTARPRFLITAFPLIIAVAAWWPTRRRADERATDRAGDGDDRLDWATTGWDMTLVLGGAGVAVLTGLYAVFGAIP
ncbi:MAG: glycosyltransferase family 39 protein [Ilumatobacteraceae bacterium]